MTNSLIILFVALLFLAFGYACLVRIAYKEYFTENQGIRGELLSSLTQYINRIGDGAVFTCLAATSLLLFWGWGMALLWLIAFHLLAETVFNMQLSTAHQNADNTSLSAKSSLNAEGSLSAEGSKFGHHLLEWVWQVYILLIIAMVVALLVNLINQQTGLIFALIALFPAHALLRKKESDSLKPLNSAISIGVLLLGLLFSHQLGISIFGAFNPLESLGYSGLASKYFTWLIFDNTSIITIALIISGLVLSDQTKFRSDLSSISGFFILAVLLALITKLAWLRPVIDAPLNSVQTRETGLPSFASLGLFLFASLSLLLLRENKIDQKKPVYKKITDGLDGADDPAPSTFIGLQITSLSLAVFSISLLLTLAGASGIGAWSTHYIDWGNAGSLTTHFNLALTSSLNLIYDTADSGSLIYSLFMAGIAFTGFVLLLNSIAKLGKPIPTTKQATNSLAKGLTHSKTLSALIIYVISSFLTQNGITINLWLLFGMLAWLLVTNIIVQNCQSYEGSIRIKLAQNTVCLAFIIIGTIQIVWTIISWANNERLALSISGSIILFIATILWKNQLKHLISPFKNNKSPELFS